MSTTFYWHDYETFGLDPVRDRPAQFAGIRTDFELNPIGDPLVIYCQPAMDYLPQPEACLVTGITPQLALQKGIPEAEFIALIHQQMAQAQTCSAGYNNLRFDDEVTRNLLYRNFYDPYAREWQNGNSRWDLIDLTRAARALRPDGIQWPCNEEGVPSLRLEHLTQANGLQHGSAHDALSDVYATIEFARLLKRTQARLFQFVLNNRSKDRVLALLKLGSMQPLVHVSGMYPASTGNLAVVLPLCQHPRNTNGVLVYDLSVDPEPMLSLPADIIHQCVFTAADELPEGLQRIPLKTVHINKCPVLAPMSVLRRQDSERLNIDPGLCQKHLQQIKNSVDLIEKLNLTFTMTAFDEETDPDLMLYSGGFFSEKDRQLIAKIRQTDVDKLAAFRLDFSDRRLPEMLFRYRARNFPKTLTEQEQKRWRCYCLDKLIGAGNEDDGEASLYEAYKQKLSGLKESGLAEQNLPILHDLAVYADDLIASLQ